jgi:RNA polymerase sigma factor (sigma-70 family)
VFSSDEHASGAANREPPEALNFDVLFRECAADVHSYAISLLGDCAGAEDVTALAFERLYRARSRLDRRRGTPRALLFSIARNAALDELRRRRRSDQKLAREHQREVQAVDPFEHAEQRAIVLEALSELPPREREVVLLKFHGQLSGGELAQALGVSQSNAGTRLYRALEHLRESCLARERQEVA